MKVHPKITAKQKRKSQELLGPTVVLLPQANMTHIKKSDETNVSPLRTFWPIPHQQITVSYTHQ